MLSHALACFDRVIFLIRKDNIRSRRVMEKIGGQQSDRAMDALVVGQLVCYIIYIIDLKGFYSNRLGAGPLKI
ncbi:MAG TPA: hypothetical protein VF463_03310 [Sphingobium sp.]